MTRTDDGTWLGGGAGSHIEATNTSNAACVLPTWPVPVLRAQDGAIVTLEILWLTADRSSRMTTPPEDAGLLLPPGARVLTALEWKRDPQAASLSLALSVQGQEVEVAEGPEGAILPLALLVTSPVLIGPWTVL